MVTRIDTTWLDLNKNGAAEEIHRSEFQFASDGKLEARFDATWNTDTGVSYTQLSQYVYDAAGRIATEFYNYDVTPADGVIDQHAQFDRTFDAAGRVSSEVALSPDYDGDGIIGDYQNWTLFTYDAAGRLVAKETDYFADGYSGPSDYHNEFWSYDAAGRLTEFRVDDPIIYDNEIIRSYHYKNGGLQNIKEVNEFRYGDTRPRIDESFTYNKDGSLKTHTDWADYSDKGWFQRVDTAYTYRPGYDNARVTYDREGDFHPEAVKLVENWYNGDGRLTHTLVSHDNEGNGGPLAGGFDYRDLTVSTWNGRELVEQTVDLGLDGIIDSHFLSGLLIA